MRYFFWAIGITLIAAISITAEPMPFAPNHVLVKAFPQTMINSVAALASGSIPVDPIIGKYRLTQIKPIGIFRQPKALATTAISAKWYLWTLASTENISEIVDTLKQSPSIIDAQPDYIYQTCLTPNDPYFINQPGLTSIRAPQGWDIEQGSSQVPIAVIDTGVQWNHPDLVGHIWQNTNEIPANNIDDDHNGYIDDVRGWDFVNLAPNTAYGSDDDYYTEDNDPSDAVGHGTHVAGIIGAGINNGIGIAGISNCAIMPLRAGFRLDTSGSFYISSIIDALAYADSNHAKVVNMSLGGYLQDTAFLDAVTQVVSDNIVVVVAAGNSNVNLDNMYNSPASFPGVITVAATDPYNNNTRASYSNYGSAITIAAPGSTIASTFPSNAYVSMSGTSMAAPHVAGLAGLIRSQNPGFSTTDVKNQITTYATDLGATGKDPYFGYGLIDIYSALSSTQPPPALNMIFSSTYPNMSSIFPDATIRLSFTASPSATLSQITVTLVTSGQIMTITTSDSRLVYTTNSLSIPLKEFYPKKLGLGSDIVISVVITDTMGRTASAYWTYVFSIPSTLLDGASADGPILAVPNPFNPTTQSVAICYQTGSVADIKLWIYTMDMKKVRLLTDRSSIGYNEILWDGKTESGSSVSPGIYIGLLSAQANGKTQTKTVKIWAKTR